MLTLKLKTFIRHLFCVFCFFPYLAILSLKTDAQPNALILSFAIFIIVLYCYPENKLVIYGNTIVDYVRFQKIRIAANPSKLWKGMIFYHQSSFTRTDILKKYCFDISYHIAAEYNFFISIWHDFGEDVFYKTNFFISYYDFNGFSNTNRIMSLQERRKILKTKHLLSITKQLYYLYFMLRTIVVLFVKKLINKSY
jgi:hypothetical protein